MEINELLQNAFLSEWDRLSSRNVTPYLNLIRENFAIINVRNRINENIRSSSDKTLRERYHRHNLNELARLYARTLYQVSNSGANINEAIIRQAKMQMKSEKMCDTYPC